MRKRFGQVDSAERTFNKLTRTFAMQMEAPRRYRSGAEQRVILQHVSVAQGGQAIVGNVAQAPRKNGREKVTQEKAATPPPVRTDTNVVPMPSMDKCKKHDRLSARRKETRERRSQAQHGNRCFPVSAAALRPAQAGPASHHRSMQEACMGGALGSGGRRGKNALKHGRYTREAIAERAHIRELVRHARKLLLQVK
jgi:hypothetical protein